MAVNIEDIQNSERLLNLSNQVLDSYNERIKALKGINEAEKMYRDTISQQQKLSQHITANADKYIGYQIKSKDLEKQINATHDNRVKSQKQFIKIEDELLEKKKKSEKNIAKIVEDVNKRRKIVKKLDEEIDLKQIQRNIFLKANKTSEADRLQKEIRESKKLADIEDKKIEKLEKNKQVQIGIARSIKNIVKNAKEVKEAQDKEEAVLIENLRIRKQIEKSTGLLGAISKSVAKLPGIGQYLNADEAINEMEKLAAEMAAGGKKATDFGNRLEIAGRGLSTLAKGFYENIKSPEAVFTFFISAAIKANKESVNLSKNLGYGAENADRVRDGFVDIERSANDINVTTANLSEAFNELSSATGFVTEYSADALQTQIKLTKQLGLSGNEAAGIYELSVLNGKSSEATYQSMLKGYVNTRNSLKVGVPFKAAIAEAAKVSGQLAANMGYNAEKIISGVVATKALGTSLEQAKSQGASLLEFQSSIEDELQAELITGKQLNLEKARAAALMGDQVAVAEELAAQGMTATEFSNMNVIAQNAYAKALGTTSNELADQLKKREVALASGKSLAEITAKEAEEATERQNIQEKFNAAMEKLQSLIGNLFAGPLGGFLEVLSGALDIVNQIGKAFSFLAGPLKAITSIWLGIKGIQLAIYGIEVAKNVAKNIGIGLDRASFALKAQSMGQEFFINRAKKVGLILDKQSLVSKIAYNAQLLYSLIREQGFAGIKTYIKTLDKQSLVSKIAYNAHSLISLIREQGLAGIKTYILGLEEKNLARKIIMGVYDTAAVIAAKTKALFEGLSLKSIIAYIGKLPALLGLRSTEAAIATTTAAATVTTASAGTLGIGTVAIIAGIAAIMGALATYAVMKDGIIDPEKGPILTGDFGSVQLDPRDKAMYDADGNIKVGTNLTKSKTPSINGPIKSASYTNYENNKQAPPLDLTPMISVMNDVKSAIGHLNNKKWDVYLDSSRVGRGMVKGQTQSA
jgi:hypothetical protein